MTDHWEDVQRSYADTRRYMQPYYDADQVDAARAKDAEAHAAALAAKDAEIAVLKGIHADVYAAAFADGKREADAEIARLRAQVQQWRDHIDRSAEIENVADLYRRDPLAMADAIVRMREDVGALRAEKD